MKRPHVLRKDHMSFRTNELMNLQEATQSGNFGSDSQEEMPDASSPMLKGRSMEAHSQLHASLQPNLKQPTSAAYNGLNVLKSHRSKRRESANSAPSGAQGATMVQNPGASAKSTGTSSSSGFKRVSTHPQPNPDERSLRAVQLHKVDASVISEIHTTDLSAAVARSSSALARA